MYALGFLADHLQCTLYQGDIHLLIVHGILHGVGVIFKPILRINALSLLLVIILVLLGIPNHTLNFIFGQSALQVSVTA